MKKIEYLSLNPGYIRDLLQLIRSQGAQLNEEEEFTRAFSHLADGACSAVMLEACEDTHSAQGDDTIVCGDLKINARTRKVVRDGEELFLTPKEFDILYFLAVNRGDVFTKEQIYQAVWEKDYLLDDSNIMAFIRKLRKKIEPSPDAPKYIITIWGVGYKFNDSL